ncbi:multidomain presynaptic cytomatrix related protein [Aspergillus ibericus CBS 121593]|uniref:Autophagy-related protein 29 n=1 Tax=Aspergillus ibericus CBS 121593 TaxID=1448316 RepID=A0A395HDU1_9EURO|nr:hypothetical protein BO80DRAFT_346064 [Aspergillus ibericus CBS 121593]RAL05158.1 hypothetical protein BO80DRAFT_346064 [Aspergillus ibericus CBS 121593]
MTSLNQSGDTKFTVFIRLPFPRGDFVDPPPVEWNAAKDQALWDILSRLPKGDDLDCKEGAVRSVASHRIILTNCRADRFDVTLQFLLQQAAWLYDRQLSQVRAQMLKVPTQSNPASPAPGSVSGSTAQVQQTKGASNPGPRAPSRLSQQKDTIPQRAPIPRRTSSTTTVNQVKSAREPFRNDTPAEPREPRRESYTRQSVKREQAAPPSAPKSPTLEDDITSSSSGSESESDDDKIGSRHGLRFRPQFGAFSTHRPGLRDDEDDDDDSPAFLPDLDQTPHETFGDDPSNTLRMNPDLPGSSGRPRGSVATESSASSASSGVPVTHSHSHSSRRPGMNQSGGPLSPQRGPFSPRPSLALRRDASEGTPSMGSSFSDLDDTSVTQSALEEALMSNMQQGGMASRMSTLSQAFRSRYLGRANDRF